MLRREGGGLEKERHQAVLYKTIFNDWLVGDFESASSSSWCRKEGKKMPRNNFGIHTFNSVYRQAGLKENLISSTTRLDIDRALRRLHPGSWHSRSYVPLFNVTLSFISNEPMRSFLAWWAPVLILYWNQWEKNSWVPIRKSFYCLCLFPIDPKKGSHQARMLRIGLYKLNHIMKRAHKSGSAKSRDAIGVPRICFISTEPFGLLRFKSPRLHCVEAPNPTSLSMLSTSMTRLAVCVFVIKSKRIQELEWWQARPKLVLIFIYLDRINYFLRSGWNGQHYYQTYK